MFFNPLNGASPERVLVATGFVPQFILADDPRSIADQLQERYAHGGGWFPFGRDQWKLNPETFVLSWPDDPPLHPVADLYLHGERLIAYSHAIFALIRPDGSFEVARLD